MIGSDCFSCSCTPVKCRMPNELLMTVKGFNYSWNNTPAVQLSRPALSQRTKCGPCRSPGIITCGGNCCPEGLFSLCNKDEGCCGELVDDCDKPGAHCCFFPPANLSNDYPGDGSCSLMYYCNCVYPDGHFHRWPRDQWTGAPMCEMSGHPLCGQYGYLCQQPPEPATWVKHGFTPDEEMYINACTHGQYGGPGWGKSPADFKSTLHLPRCEKFSREAIDEAGLGERFYNDLSLDTAGNFIPSATRSLHGSVNLWAPDLNNRPFILHRVYANVQPRLRPRVSRSRTPPTGVSLIDAQLLFDLKQYTVWREEALPFTGAGQTEWNIETLELAPVDPNATLEGNWQVWRVDYPCLPEIGPSECTGDPGGIVAPLLRAFKGSSSGSGAVLTHVLQPISNPVYWDPGPDYETITWQNARISEGFVDRGTMWCVSSVSVGSSGGRGYKVDDEFYFDFYENPARGGELRVPITDTYQRARVTSVDKLGTITGIKLYPPPDENTNCPDYTTTYGRLLGHRKAVSIAGNGYVEGDILEWYCVDGKPSGSGEVPYTKFSFGCNTKKRARATVTEVDCRGGIVDWFMCGAQNFFFYPKTPPTCKEDNRGEYSDFQYTERCAYSYIGFLPVRYSYAAEAGYASSQAGDDPCSTCCRVGPFPRNYMPSGSKGCGPAYCQFNYNIYQISVKNRVEISDPFPGGSRALAKITAIDKHDRTVEDPKWTKNPNNFYRLGCPQLTSNWATYYRDFEFPSSIPQGGVSVITLLKKGSGYARKNNDGTVTTKTVKVKITAVFDEPLNNDEQNERFRGKGEQGYNKCQAHAVIDEDPDSKTFGQIKEIVIDEPGKYYFAEAHDHVWLAIAETQFEPYLDYAPAPVVDANGVKYDPPEDWDIHGQLLEHRRRHSRRYNWGHARHKDGYVEKCGTGAPTCDRKLNNPPYYDYMYEGIDPYRSRKLTEKPGSDVMGNYSKRWSKKYCPTDLLNIYFDMVWEETYIPNPFPYIYDPGASYVPNTCGNYGVHCSGVSGSSGHYDDDAWFSNFTQVWDSMGLGPIRFTITDVVGGGSGAFGNYDPGNVTEESS